MTGGALLVSQCHERIHSSGSAAGRERGSHAYECAGGGVTQGLGTLAAPREIRVDSPANHRPQPLGHLRRAQAFEERRLLRQAVRGERARVLEIFRATRYIFSAAVRARRVGGRPRLRFFEVVIARP
jgi:hypothetical protein